MCGIVGYVGARPAQEVLLDGLGRLEYRGYDSAGAVTCSDHKLQLQKAEGRLARLVSLLGDSPLAGWTGIGHTRWATHGKPSDGNAHPHADCSGRIAVVHNGIIENYIQLKEDLQARGHVFLSETDTEVIPHLIEEAYRGDLGEAVRKALSRMEGSWAVAALAADEPDRVVVARKDSPLIIGLGEGENFVASDIPAILPYTRDVLVLEDGETAVVHRDRIHLTNGSGSAINRKPLKVDWDPIAAQKGGYPHFMLKEIHEQPKALRDTLRGRLSPDLAGVTLPELGIDPEEARNIRKLWIVACGTACHAGLVGKRIVEDLLRLPVEVDLASEFRYRQPLVGPDDLTVVISQSGETADTLAGLREAKRRGSKVVAIVNVVGSSISREADACLYTWAGPEVAVASTKAYLTQLLALYLFSIHLGQLRGTVDRERARELAGWLKALPEQVQEVLGLEPAVAELAATIKNHDHVFFIGRGLDHLLSMEGALKLKEISYIHAEAYAAGELKHGTLALVVSDTPVVALATQKAVQDKMVSNIKEVKARGARVIAVARGSDVVIPKVADHRLPLPEVPDILAPVVAVVPLQLLAYYAARARGCDVDKPRNLAKSVTVE
ncbi:MAG: glutamine--fructose-6-phosphate transaminase (isomerizing) [Firmicutes bacterium]|nr:glutamine--fructose-6-phosphate transaminase (isomerizing) [Bacillota bacterium]